MSALSQRRRVADSLEVGSTAPTRDRLSSGRTLRLGAGAQMTDNLKQLGADGERVVRAHLERLGWSVVTSNFRCPAGEMDIIAEQPSEKGAVLVFVEVKTRRGVSHGAPIESVDARKIERLRNVALAFLAARGAGGDEPACRFDIAEVRQDQNGLCSVRLHSGVQADT